jgi:hypothetical protein
VKGLVDEQGVCHEDLETMGAMVKEYFGALFIRKVSEIDDGILTDVDRKVTAEMNQLLLAPFTREEVKKALFSIGDLKALRLDGLHVIFFKRFWNLLEDDLVDEVLGAVQSAFVPMGWNDTTIVMIPKIDNPDKVTHFRPISLCNVMYKIISKMLSFRLKAILPEIISDHQSTFVPRRLIMDNILLAYECIHTMKKKKGSKGLCAIKLDMHKAYDRVEWVFLERIMAKLGFDQRWIKLVMACVTFVRYSVRFNNFETDIFTPFIGLRQGDALSPYLFLMVAEGLSCMIKKAEERGELEGVKVCRGALTISHLLFADDSLILMQADKKNVDCLASILNRYCANSGQKISEAKSSIYFSSNTDVEVKTEVCQILNIMTESLSDKYLGHPTLVGADRSDCFRHF